MATSVDAKLLKATKFPTEFSQKVDMQKVNLEVMKKYAILLSISPIFDLDTDPCNYRWIAGKISEILGSEDDVVIELCFNLIEGARFVRQIQPNNRAMLTDGTARY
jgi:serine/arginine repetitive matrix protein 1